MNLDILKQIDLAGFLGRRYDIHVASNGAALCPFHEDHDPSLSVSQKNGIGLFKCHGCDAKGSILDFVMRKEGVGLADAARHIQELEGIQDDSRPSAKKRRPAPWDRPVTGETLEAEYPYTDEQGVVLYVKRRFRPKDFDFHHTVDGKPTWDIKGVRRVLFHLPEVIKNDSTWLVEGEKDVLTLEGLGFVATTGGGENDWRDEFLSFFTGKEVIVCWDTDAAQIGRQRALAVSKIAATTLLIDLEKQAGMTGKQDITDFINGLGDLPEDEKSMAVNALAQGAEKIEGPAIVRKPFTGTLADFFNVDLPEAEFLIDRLLAREEFMLLGAVKHAHKTTAMMDLGLHFTGGRESWLNFPIPRPGRFLMVQQELGEAEFRKRLRKAVDGGRFDPDNFFPYTGTGDPIKLMEDEGFSRLCGLCDKFKPDILGLDPLHTFMVGGENRDEAFAAIRDRINYLKTTYNCGVIISHHFSSKRPKEDPDAPAEAGGWFRGHSVLSDAADVLFLLHRLPGQKDNPNLRLSYEDYNAVEITLRNGKWPPRFATEFNEQTFLLSVSDVWHEVGAKIGFGEVREYCEAQGGAAMLADLVIYFKTRDKDLSPHTVRKAVDKEVQAGYVITEVLPGKGRPILVKSRQKT